MWKWPFFCAMIALTVPIGRMILPPFGGMSNGTACCSDIRCDAKIMKKQTPGPVAPQVASTEAVQTATEDAIDQLCWTVAQVLKRVLDLAPARAGEQDVGSRPLDRGGQR
jgi:hypothetical protein